MGLLATAVLQAGILLFTGSVALLADTIHNFGDAATAIPLWIAFRLASWKPSKQYTYGYHRVEDLAGMVIVLIIWFSAIAASYESIHRLMQPRPVQNLWAVMMASIAGFLGNEAVAKFRIRVGKEIGSAALMADGYHARVDGLASLAVLFGGIGIWLGYPWADPLAGLLITAAIIRIGWESGKTVFTRLLDGVDPGITDEIRYAVHHVRGVLKTTEIRVRWLGHRLHSEVSVAVDPALSVERGHEIATEVQHELLHHLHYLSSVTVHIDPATAAGEAHHRLPEHTHAHS